MWTRKEDACSAIKLTGPLDARKGRARLYRVGRDPRLSS